MGKNKTFEADDISSDPHKLLEYLTNKRQDENVIYPRDLKHSTLSQKEEESMAGRVLFQGTLQLLSQPVICMLTVSRLFISFESSLASLDLEKEVYHVQMTNSNPNEIKFKIHVLIETLNFQYRNLTLEFQADTSRRAREWVHAVNDTTLKLYRLADAEPEAFMIQEMPDEELTLNLPTRRVFCIVNPYSGSQDARKSFYTDVKPMLDNCTNIVIKIIETASAGHAIEICEALDLDEWGEICCCGGDGILNEVLQGLLKHKDQDKAVKVPIANIPMGSTNALMVQILGKKSVELATFALVKGFVKPMDVCSVFRNGKRQFFFLKFLFGLFSDVIDSAESFRKIKLKMVRYNLGVFRELASKTPDSKAKLEYVPFIPRREEVEHFERTLEQGYSATDYEYMLKRHRKQRTNIYHYMMGHLDGEPNVQENPLDCPMIRRHFPECFGTSTGAANDSTSSVTTSNEPLESLVTVEGTFLGFMASNVSHESFNLGLTSYMNSGFLDLLWIKGEGKDNTVSRGSLFKHFIKLLKKEAALVDHKNVHVAKTKCFKLDPIRGKSVGLDGETFRDLGACYCEIHHNLINLFVL